MSTEYNAALSDEMWGALQRQARNIDPQLVLDIAGIFDPTPISDGASTLVSLWRGEFVDALLGGASMVPYLGDAAAKPFKIARKYGPEAMKVIDGLDTLRKAKTAEMMDALRKIEPAAVHRARERAAEAVKKAQAKKRAGCNTEACKKVRRSNMPKNGGTWDPPNARETGNGKWTFTDGKGKTQTVEYTDGYPNFGPHTYGGADNKFHLDNVTNDVEKDTKALIEQYPEAFPTGTKPEGYTLHHLEDGSVAFVDSAVHDNISHSGFRSIEKTDLF
jgi:hypothetical protein